MTTDSGCEACWSQDAAVAWERVTRAPIEAYLIDETHFIVSIRRCRACSRNYLQVTTETIDWDDGEDPIQRTVMPITPAERLELLDPRSTVSELALAAVGPGRRALRYDWPKGTDPGVYWGTGVLIPPHD